MNQTHNIPAEGSNTLVVFVHAYSLKAASLKSLEEAVLKVWPEAISFRPDLPFSLLSLKDANHIVEEHLLKKIDQIVERAEAEGRAFKKIVLNGHSLGDLLAKNFTLWLAAKLPRLLSRISIELILRHRFRRDRGQRKWSVLFCWQG